MEKFDLEADKEFEREKRRFLRSLKQGKKLEAKTVKQKPLKKTRKRKKRTRYNLQSCKFRDILYFANKILKKNKEGR